MTLSRLALHRLAPSLVWPVGVILLLLLAALELRVGSRLVGWRDVFLFPTAPETLAQAILETTRAPRMVAAISTGAALALAGSVLQTVLRNPLAAPDILSVTSGAQLFLVISTLLLPLALPPIIATSAGGLAGAAACLALAGGFQAAPGRLALSGIAVSLCFSAISSAIVLLADERASGLLLWSSGILDQTGWARVATAIPLVLLSFLMLMVMARALDLLGLGDQASASLGVTRAVTLFGLLVGVLLCGAAVTLAGPIGFIGLAVPNVLRALGIIRHHRHLPLSMVWGANTLLLADVVTQSLAHNGASIPTGVTVACLGAPAMLLLLRKAKIGGERRIGLPVGIAPPPLPLAATALAALGLIVIAASLATGDGLSLTIAEVTGNLDLRAPRLLVALGCGALLAAAGTVLQAVTRNPLCGPETLGLTQGAALFSLVALLLGFAPATPTFQAVALAGAITVLLLLRLLAPKYSPEKFVLAGVAIAASLGAAATIIVVEARLQTAQALSWLIGSTHARGYADAVVLVPWVFALSAIGLLFSRHLDAFLLGDEKARSLGLATGNASKYAMLYAAVAVAIAVSSIGAVSFVGLLAPHAARLLTGARHAKSLPVAMALGAVMLAFADTIGRSIIAPLELPAGIITAIIGAPAFMLLLRSGLRSRS
ncbi:UNVERIFIED_ORG: ABC-type Fe3+-siderophore transport system permease subunit [Rhizobium sp. SORGH_AS260]|nr:iron ABC transporter permease [Agrobacterium pusense]MCJ2874569.1 iron ABC transporter permease [Agrobacterium pusense]MDP9731014.1 ABC-type Fe3+-siderophore transport system permease subunit [Rhizobium sp. SORGH_AS_0285]MDP9752933.1 ABC-type Fe3+-siderophore transport system permease subunit [Rhizobium sp. SORGH_AS_0260]MDR6079901.1 ABC-type Fe3+-siderophore transport system permease subunit [Agrobacterium sp. SORGH_AS_0440]